MKKKLLYICFCFKQVRMASICIAYLIMILCGLGCASTQISSNAIDPSAGIEVVFEPAIVRAVEGGPSGEAYTWIYRTTVRSLVGPVTIKEFLIYRWENDTWVFDNYTGRPFPPEYFEASYSCQDAILLPGQAYSDPGSWSGFDALHRWKIKWVFIGVTSDGKEVKGEAIVELLDELIR